VALEVASGAGAAATLYCSPDTTSKVIATANTVYILNGSNHYWHQIKLI
jgi:hypothetical protein